MSVKPVTAIAGGLKDVFGGRLGGFALLCFVVALGATVATAWAAFRYLLPLVPEGEGWRRYLWNAAEFLSGAGVLIFSIVLAPTISMIVGSVLFDIAAARVERHVGLPRGAPGGADRRAGERIAHRLAATRCLISFRCRCCSCPWSISSGSCHSTAI